MISRTSLSLSVIAMVIIACVWLTPTDATFCRKVRCQNGTSQSDRCRKTDSMDTCLNLKKTVTFPKPFRQPPKLHYGLNHIDLKQGKPQSAEAKVTEITKEGFAVIWACKYGSLCFGLDINWMACGEM